MKISISIGQILILAFWAAVAAVLLRAIHSAFPGLLPGFGGAWLCIASYLGADVDCVNLGECLFPAKGIDFEIGLWFGIVAAAVVGVATVVAMIVTSFRLWRKWGVER